MTITDTLNTAGAASVSATATAAAQADSRASLRDAIWLIGRAFAYVRPFKWRFFGRWWFNALGLVPILYLPWPARALLDHVIGNQPIDAAAIAHYPPYLQWAARLLAGKSPTEIALWLLVASFVTLVLFGLFGQGANAQNTIGGGAENTSATRTAMGSGSDTAANSENSANQGGSYASGLYGLFEYRFALRLSQALNHYYRSKLFERIKALPMTSIEDRRTGDMIYRVMYDTPMITGLLYDVLLTPFAVGTFAMVLYVMNFSFGRAPEVVWLALAMVPVGFILTAPFSGYVRGRSAASRVAGAVTTHTIEESLSNVFAVQSLGGWRREVERFRLASAQSFAAFRGSVLAGIVVGTVAGFGSLLLLAITSMVVAGKVIDGLYSPGDYGVLFFYYAYMSGSMAAISQLWIRVQDNIAGVRRVFALLDLPAETDGGDAVLPTVRQGVRVEDATLVYPDGRKALDHVAFEAQVGQITAIVGATGAGKTSLAYLIPRFHRPTEGRVVIDGLDIAGVSLRSLRDQVTYVFQDTQLFSATIADNIRYGFPDASIQEVQIAARSAGAHDFITALPDGYDTQLGARGAKLSVGQRQRIAIARGLITDAPILILDEPTSALDPETETYLVDALQRAAVGKAVIIIAHRLSTIAQADKVVFLKDGHVIEEGRPSDLLRREGSAYAAFVRLQAQ